MGLVRKSESWLLSQLSLVVCDNREAMNVAHPVSDKIVAVMSSRRDKTVAIPDLLHLGSRAAVNQALARLAREGRIQRVGRGLYAMPRHSRLLNAPVGPSVDVLARAWARRNGLRLVPHGAYAANLLGLSTQVPAKYIFYTDGRTQTVRLGGATVRLINRGPRTMQVRGELAACLFQALRHLGSQYVKEEDLTRLGRILRPKDRADLKHNLKFSAEWMRPLLLKLLNGETT